MIVLRLSCCHCLCSRYLHTTCVSMSPMHSGLQPVLPPSSAGYDLNLVPVHRYIEGTAAAAAGILPPQLLPACMDRFLSFRFRSKHSLCVHPTNQTTNQCWAIVPAKWRPKCKQKATFECISIFECLYIRSGNIRIFLRLLLAVVGFLAALPT